MADVASTRAEIDPSLVREALANVIDNARRHAHAEVTVRATRDDDHLGIRVEDDGPGIPEGADELIFERFATLDGGGGSGPAHRDGGFELTLPTGRGAPGARA